MIFDQLRRFRQLVYKCLGKAKDSLFELMDSVLLSPSIPSFVSLSQSPVFRRHWSSAYAAIHDGRITSFENALSKASFQLQQVTRQLSIRPLTAFDRHYGNGKFLHQTAEIESDLLLRLASNRCVYGKPPA